ncbi:MAG: peptidase M50 [Halanaerobiales bacterium]|nr:peptidase M50 [Halanaerobiales bacterium]
MTILKLWGIKIKVNWLFLVIILLFALVGGLARALIAFMVVFLHELAHVFTARYYGLKIKKIELLPFGGVAVFDDMLEINPSIERRVAIAGPALNLTLLLLTILCVRYGLLDYERVRFFMSCNLSIGIFNLIPALPLDGGRILRANLVFNKGYWKATHITLQVTRILTLIAGGGAFFTWLTGKTGLISLLVAFFVYFATMKEEEQSIFVLMKYLIKKKTLLREAKLLPCHELLVSEDTLITSILKGIDPNGFTRFLIYDEDYHFLGIITEIEVLNTFFEEGRNVPVKELLSSS